MLTFAIIWINFGRDKAECFKVQFASLRTVIV